MVTFLIISSGSPVILELAAAATLVNNYKNKVVRTDGNNKVPEM